jgi:hypothetical protein
MSCGYFTGRDTYALVMLPDVTCGQILIADIILIVGDSKYSLLLIRKSSDVARGRQHRRCRHTARHLKQNHDFLPLTASKLTNFFVTTKPKYFTRDFS